MLARLTCTLPRALLFCLAAVFISTLTRAWGVLSTDDDAIGVAWRVHVSLQTPALLEAFVFGMAVALRSAGMAAPPRVGGAWRRFAWLLAGITLFALAASTYSGPPWAAYQTPLTAIGLRSVGALAAVATLLFALNWPPQWSMPKLFVKLGQLSYGIYLWHYLLILIVANVGDHLGNGVKVTMIIGLTLLLAQLTYTLVERPAQVWLLARWRAGGLRAAG